MSTQLQEKLADAIIEDAKNKRPKDGDELLESVGYRRSVARHRTGETIKRKGVMEALRVRGFSEVQADKVVSEILHNKRIKPEARLSAADKIYKRLGSYSPEKHDVRQLVVQISQEIADKNAINTN